MSDSPKPSKRTKALPSVAVDVPHTVVAGMGIVRKMLFSAPIHHDGWQKTMLTHIGAAKQLGFTMFEIDVKAEMRPRRKAKKEEPESPLYISNIFGFRAPRIEGDEWKDAEPAPETPEQSPTLAETLVVYVYALAVE